MHSKNTTAPRLTLEAREAIRQYLLKIAIPSGVTLTILSFALGFFINDLARQSAYMDAYTTAFERAMDSQSNVLSNSTARIAQSEIAVKSSEAAANEALANVRNMLQSASNHMQDALDKAEQIRAIETVSEIDAQLTLIVDELSENPNFTRRVINATVPSGMVAFFRAECQRELGWRPYQQADGRYVVGVPRDGTVEAVVGLSLDDKENRPAGQHEHTINRYNFSDRTGEPQMQFRSPGGGLVVVGTEKSQSGDGLKPGTNAPYVQLYACERI